MLKDELVLAKREIESQGRVMERFKEEIKSLKQEKYKLE